MQDEVGETAIEYGLIAALISVVIIVAIRAAGTLLNTTFNAVTTALGSPEFANLRENHHRAFRRRGL